jgi:tRNA U54 and U55 pseudouridine synthase Pus10
MTGWWTFLGVFKDMLERALAESNRISDSKSGASSVYKDLEKEFTKLVGQPIIWRTKHNTNLKAPQLVVVEKPFEHYVLVVKTSFNVEGQENKIRYGVLYSSLYCGFDTYETLEFV